MQAVILAAGMATRLKPLTDNCPKCLLDIGGTSILERAIVNVKACSIDDFVIVTGFKSQMIKDFVAAKFPALNCTFIHNDRYSETNNAYSLLLTEQAVKGEFLLLDSDIVFPSGLIRSLLDEKERPCIAASHHPCAEEEMKIRIDANGYVGDIGKTIPIENGIAESIGFEIFDAPSRTSLFRVLKKRIVDQGKENEFYEASFKELIEGGMRFKTVDTTDHPAIEIDTVDDLEAARTKIAARI